MTVELGHIALIIALCLSCEFKSAANVGLLHWPNPPHAEC